MEQHSKYYTPSIEEFHIGFEYEVLQRASPLSHNGFLTFMPVETEDKWFVFKFPDPFVGYRLDLLFKRELRVKYLDKEDIESLGFKYDGDSNTFKLKDTYEMYELDKNGEIINISRFYQTKLCSKVLPFSEWSEFNVFNGAIKNKSELKTLLQMLNIE